MLGLMVMACGVAPVLGALEIIPYPLTSGTPAWVGVAAGGIFILGGAAVINRYAFGGGENAGRVLALAILASFAAIGAWIGFAPGHREFSTSISLPFWNSDGQGNVDVGRAAFGLGAIICAVFAIALVFDALRRHK